MDQPLDDVRVLDLTHHLAGPFCTKYLADYGADVIKVERPDGGDPARTMAPFHHDEPHLEKSGMFLFLNANKRSVTLDLKNTLGRRILEELVRSVDILVESFSPRVMPGLGLDFDRLLEINPGLVVTSISNFGQTGPYRDYRATDLIEYGMGGPMYVTGLADREPVRIAEGITQFQAGVSATAATLIAFYESELSGEGQHIDISIMEPQLGSIDRRTLTFLSYQYTGEVSRRLSLPAQWKMASGTRRSSDGFVDISADGPSDFSRVAQMIGMPELLEDPRFATTEARIQDDSVAAFDAIFTPWMLDHTKQEIMDVSQGLGFIASAINTSEDLYYNPHFRYRGLWTEAEHPEVGRVEAPSKTLILNESPWSLRRPAPTLGQHNREVLGGELGYSNREMSRMRQMGVI